jgi:RNA polymerase sigma-70 factor (ECF subfamily)
MAMMDGWDSQSDDALIVAAPREAGAFTAFYRRYERPMLAYFLGRTRDAELAADLTAEVFAAVLIASERYRPGRAPGSAWLFGIAHHKLASSRRRGRVEDKARRKLRMEPVVLEDEDLERIERVAGGDAGRAALIALAELPDDQREAVTARIVDDRGYVEIAQQLRCSEAVVRKRVSRGLTTLRRRLGEEQR